MYVNFLEHLLWAMLIFKFENYFIASKNPLKNRTSILFISLFVRWTKELKIIYDWCIMAVFISEKKHVKVIWKSLLVLCRNFFATFLILW